MATLSRAESWKNKRKRSLYVEEGYAGFIFYRKSKTPRGDKERGDRETEAPRGDAEVIDAEDPPAESEEEEAVEGEPSPLSEQQLERLVEVKSFVAQIKRELKASGLNAPDDKLEEVCRELYEELKSEVTADSGSYIQYMEANEEQDKLPPHPLDGQLAETVRLLRQRTEMYERETREWEDLVERKKAASQLTREDLESNMSVDWSQLGPEDEARLQTHLTSEQRGWLEHATSQRHDAEWEERTESELQAVRSSIDEELGRIHTYTDSVLQKCASEISKLASETNLPTETPRALFRALKDTH